ALEAVGRPASESRPPAHAAMTVRRAERPGSEARSFAAATPWRRVLLLAYGCASAALLVWWMLGQVLLWRVTRRARPAPPAVREQFLAISGPAGERVRLLESDRIALPLTSTWTCPVILLPASLIAEGEREALDFCLAHEWSHVERCDARAWNLAAFSGA